MTASRGSFERQIERLESSAASVLSMKREARPKRPFVIEFCGSPKSGKSQAVTSLTIFLKRNGFNVKILTERASVSPVSDKRNPFFNIWTGSSVLTGLIPYLSEPVTDVDVVIADRGVFDTLCWFTWLQDNGALPVEEAKDFVNFFSTKRFRQATDLVIAFTASPEASMEREYANLLTRKFGSIMAPRVLKSYVASIKKTIKQYGSSFKEVQLIDTSTSSQSEVAVKVTSTVLQAMREELVEKVGVVRRSVLERVADGEREFDASRMVDPSVEVSFLPRTTAESDPSMVQLVPIVVIADERLKRVMAFRKRRETLARSDRSESPEQDKNLLYVGGHMRSEDAFGMDHADLLQISRTTIEREMSEELGTTIWLSPDPPFCLWDFDGMEASQRHMAVVYLARVRFEELKLRLDGYELVQPHNSDISGKVIGIHEVVRWAPKQTESWSRAIITRIFGEPYALRGELMDFDNYLITES